MTTKRARSSPLPPHSFAHLIPWCSLGCLVVLLCACECTYMKYVVTAVYHVCQSAPPRHTHTCSQVEGMVTMTTEAREKFGLSINTAGTWRCTHPAGDPVGSIRIGLCVACVVRVWVRCSALTHNHAHDHLHIHTITQARTHSDNHAHHYIPTHTCTCTSTPTHKLRHTLRLRGHTRVHGVWRERHCHRGEATTCGPIPAPGRVYPVPSNNSIRDDFHPGVC